MKIFESDKIFAFLDIQPLSRGHSVRNKTPPKSNSIPSLHNPRRCSFFLC